MKMSADQIRGLNKASEALVELARNPGKYDLTTDQLIDLNAALDRLQEILVRVRVITS